MPAHPRRRLLPTSVVLALALLATSAVYISGIATAPTATAVTYTVKGVDIASWQHPSGAAINWSKVKGAGYSFAIVKATESTTYRNPYFTGDRSGAQAQGMVVGAYHFARPALPISTATAQARYFAATIGTQRLGKTLPPILDIESTGGLSKANLAAWMSQFLTTVRSATGRTPMIYSYDSFLRNNVANVTTFRGYPLWYANYTTTPPKTLPGGWTSFRLWQHSSTGSVPGISGKTDLNRYNGSYSNLLSFASGMVPASVFPASVQAREPARISGRVDPAYAGEPIVRQVPGKKKGTWRTVEKKRVWGNGYYVFSVRQTAKGSHAYRIMLDSRSPYAKVNSKALTVKVVKPWVNVSMSTSSMKKGRTAHLTGRVDTFYAGEKVLRQKRSASGKWTTTATRKVGKNGRFDFGVKPTTRGTQTYRVLLRATGPKAWATSRTVKIRIV